MSDSEAKKAWNKANTVVITMKLNKNTDGEIIKKLAEQENRQKYIKNLIKRDIG